MNTFGMNVVASDKTFYQGRGVRSALPFRLKMEGSRSWLTMQI